MSKMFLDDEELRELTHRTHHTSQMKVLKSMGIEHRTRPDGSAAVLRSHVEAVLGGAVAAPRKKAPTEPNWGALNATLT